MWEKEAAYIMGQRRREKKGGGWNGRKETDRHRERLGGKRKVMMTKYAFQKHVLMRYFFQTDFTSKESIRL